MVVRAFIVVVIVKGRAGKSLETRFCTYECPTSSHQKIYLHGDFAKVFFVFVVKLFLRGSKRRNSVHMTLMGLKRIPI